MPKKILLALEIFLIVLLIIFIAANLWQYSKDQKKAPAKQNLTDAYMTVYAPILEKTEDEKNKTVSPANKVVQRVSYNARYKEMDYSISFTQFAQSISLQSAIDSLQQYFKNEDFKFNVEGNIVNDLEGVLINGTFERNSKTYCVKAQFIKDGVYFWQALVIFKKSDFAQLQADNFINSIVITKTN
jgi:uncharacterized alpha/beta hydrolase family protein